MESFLFISRLKNPWTNVYGMARSVLAFGTCLTLIFNNSKILFYNPNTGGAVQAVKTVNIFKWNFFTCFSISEEIMRVVAILILLAVISGWRPMITGIFHAWISVSFIHICPFIDGGDWITSILSVLLLPICLTDSRVWHWKDKSISSVKNLQNPYLVLFCLSIYLVIRVQVALIYLNAATAKLGVNERVDGTAAWYWFRDYAFGYNYYIAKFMDPVLKNPFLITLITWLSIFFEFFMFLGLFVRKRFRKYFLYSGALFHFLIIIIHGLFPFFFAMLGALILYLRPIDLPFNFSFLIAPGKRKMIFKKTVC